MAMRWCAVVLLLAGGLAAGCSKTADREPEPTAGRAQAPRAERQPARPDRRPSPASRPPERLDRAQALRTLKAQADAMSQAMLRKDHAALADLTHPAVVRAVGGREKFLAILERMDAELRGRGLSF